MNEAITMLPVSTIEQVYPAIDELTNALRSAGQTRLANVLAHRVHVVAWTSGSELLEELQRILTLKSTDVPPELREQTGRILAVIEEYLETSRSNEPGS